MSASELDELRVSVRRSDCVGLRLVRTIVANFLSVGEATRVADGGMGGVGEEGGALGRGDTGSLFSLCWWNGD